MPINNGNNKLVKIISLIILQIFIYKESGKLKNKLASFTGARENLANSKNSETINLVPSTNARKKQFGSST